MNYNKCIFPIPEIELMILDYYLNSITDIKTLSLVNKYFSKIAMENKIFVEFVKFRKDKDLIRLREKYGINLQNPHIMKFEKACKKGYLYVMNYLSEKSSRYINIHTRGGCWFRLCCKYGHLEAAKWLYQSSQILDHRFFEGYSCDDNAFCWSCRNGHIDVAKWLYQLSQSKSDLLDIHIHNEFAFRWSCENGHIEIAKWLYQLSQSSGKLIDIHAESDYAFIQSCRSKQFHVVEWLCSLDPSFASHVMYSIHIK